MALRAKKPIVKDARLKALIFASEGSGKTHLCCSFPDTYYIDTEGLEDHPQFVKMIRDNGGDLVYLTELSEIISEVKELLSTKHNYKTLVIDSISFPYGWLSQIEADRLAKKSGTDGTEFGANLAKAKRMTFKLGMLLSRLDMNVLVTSHERVKYEDGKEIGKTYDITDKMAYTLGSVWNLQLLGKSRKLIVRKSRYTEMTTGDRLDFDDGYETIKRLFGELIFKRESKTEELATKEQIEEFNRLTLLLNVSEEQVNKRLSSVECVALEELNKECLSSWIDKMQSKIQGEAA